MTHINFICHVTTTHFLQSSNLSISYGQNFFWLFLKNCYKTHKNFIFKPLLQDTTSSQSPTFNWSTIVYNTIALSKISRLTNGQQHTVS
jgi:hypothetical protein